VIDIGLPISGDLNDPQFGYGAIIAKAIGNLIVRIVSAPFRALGRLFGAGAEQVDSIAFEAGSAMLAPPEREKLVSVAKALAERPGLKAVVAGVQAPALDAPALRSHAVRTAVVAATGVKLAEGEDPGPVDVSQPRVRQALESLFERRHGREALEALRQRAAATGTGDQARAPRPDGPAGAAAATDAFYREMLDRLVADEPLAEASLAALAAKRAEAVVRELAAAGVAADRMSIGDPRVDDAQEGESVTLRLELDVAK